MSNFWQAGFWATGFWSAGFWGDELPAVEAPSVACLSSFSWPKETGAAHNIAREVAASTRRGWLAGSRHALRIRR